MSGSDLIKAALQEMTSSSRRRFLRQTLSLGGLALLTGCDVLDESHAEKILMKVSRLNDRAQALLFSPTALAPTYAEALITRPFPFNAFYAEDRAPAVDADSYRLEVTGLVADKRPWTLERLRQLEQTSQVTRHICVEGWSAIGKWGGVPFASFLRLIGADTTAKYVGFKCADDYYQRHRHAHGAARAEPARPDL